MKRDRGQYNSWQRTGSPKKKGVVELEFWKEVGPFFTKSTGYKMIEDATVVALYKTVPSHFEFFPSKSNLMIRLGDVTY